MYEQLKALINQYIKTNGSRQITGAVLNNVLNEMVNSLGGASGYGGIITPTSQTPANDANIFYIAIQQGNYTNFGITVNAHELAFVKRSGNGWAKDAVPLGSGIVANPQGEATEQLSKIEIDGTIYTAPQGPQGDPGQNAVNPFKGWFDSSSDLPASGQAGDYAYVKGATSSDPAGIWAWNESAAIPEWENTQRTADTSNVQTFESGEEVNETPIDDTHLANPTQGSIPLALDVVSKLNQVGVTSSAKDLIISLFRKCAFVTDDAGDYIDDLEEEFAGTRILMSITATMPLSYEVHEGDDLNVLRNYLTVTANYDDGSSNTVSTYTLSGTLTEGTSVITVSYNGMTTQVSVTVLAPTSISFESNEFVKGINLGNNYTGTGTTYNYCVNSPTRMCSPQFGKLIEGGTYRINIVCSYSTVHLDIQAYTEAAATKVSNQQNLTSTGGGGTIDIWDSGYIQFTDGVAQVTIPKYSIQNEPTAKIIGLRVVFKQDSAGTSMSNDFTVTSLTFTKIS